MAILARDNSTIHLINTVGFQNYLLSRLYYLSYLDSFCFFSATVAITKSSSSTEVVCLISGISSVSLPKNSA